MKTLIKIMILGTIIFSLFSQVIIVSAETEPGMEVHFIDVGQGDSILLHTSDGTDILIDGGYPDQGTKILIYIRRLGIKELDLVIGTHPHADHIGGLITVLSGISVKEVIDPGVVYPAGVFENYLITIQEEKIPFRTVLAGEKIITENSLLDIEVLAPFEDQLDYGDDVNNVSIVLKVTYGDVKFLLTGDAGFDTEDLFLVNNVDLESDILKVGHHGSKYSTSNIFLASVTPEVAIIQVGENSYGHPTEEVLERLKWKDVEIYRNDHHGTVVIHTDGKEYEVKTEKVFEIIEDYRLNINSAPLGDILDIPGVNIDLAREIVRYREGHGIFLTNDELLRVDLMTPELLEEILPYIKLAEQGW
ncbi:MAG: MBL fold metallo-hydrolase [Halanaerobiales bacterium]|nr:MBL fold metallo-hydrolase [Halanaerobiales bacterium]